MKKNQLITMVSALALVGALGIGSTLAFLQAQSEVVTNTFTVGKDLNEDDILLDEAKVVAVADGYDAVENAEVPSNRHQENKYENIQAGDKLFKDPQVHIAADTADCYVFVKISGIDALKGKGITVDDWDGNSWVKFDGSDAGTDGVYYYKVGSDNVVKTSTAVQDLPKLFTGLTVADDAVFYDENGTQIDLDPIVAQACAVQAKNLTLEEAAYESSWVARPVKPTE